MCIHTEKKRKKDEGDCLGYISTVESTLIRLAHFWNFGIDGNTCCRMETVCMINVMSLYEALDLGKSRGVHEFSGLQVTGIRTLRIHSFISPPLMGKGFSL